MYNSCDTRYLRVLGQDPDLSYRAGNWRLNMGGEECFLLISGRHGEIWGTILLMIGYHYQTHWYAPIKSLDC